MNKIQIGISQEIDFKFEFNKKKFELTKLAKNNFDFHAIIITSNTNLKYKVLNNCKKLKVIFIMSLHLLSKIDLKRIRKDIKILHFDKRNKSILNEITATPEFIFGLITLLIKNFLKTLEISKMNIWDPKRTAYLSSEYMLSECTLGIIGYGRIGKKLASISKSFGMKNIIFTKRNNNSLKKVSQKSDIICICLSLNKKTKNLINKNFFKNMKKNSYFINTSKGEIVNYNDLLKYLGKNIKGAAIDVYRKEISNSPEISKLTKHAKLYNNLILTPHIAGSTQDSIIKLQGFCLKKIERYF